MQRTVKPFLGIVACLISRVVIVLGIPIENRVVGQPEARCGIESITILIHTEAPFKGRIYVEGESELHDCVHNYANDGTLESGYDSKAAEFNIRFGECNMRRQRTLNPRGVAFSFTLIVSFHPVMRLLKFNA
uniref:ZP domain-containing protein n=1 Tax=Acrobeloides nanus TaxID=290746 RepID=A0A914DER1_9BILA